VHRLSFSPKHTPASAALVTTDRVRRDTVTEAFLGLLLLGLLLSETSLASQDFVLCVFFLQLL
jgi:hypothetical protein